MHLLLKSWGLPLRLYFLWFSWLSIFTMPYSATVRAEKGWATDRPGEGPCPRSHGSLGGTPALGLRCGTTLDALRFPQARFGSQSRILR